MDELSMAVLAWADERGLIDKENAPRQMLKEIKKVGDVAGSIAKQN